MIKQKFYIKLFKFKIFFKNNKIQASNLLFINIIKMFKLLLNIKNFGIFIPDNILYVKSWIYNFWKKGLITNFKFMKWYFIKNHFLKKLPYFLINLTINNNISIEIKKKKIPFINLFKENLFNNNKIRADYFLYQFKSNISLDIIFFFIKTLSYIKKYKNV